MHVHTRLSEPAIVAGARLRARRFLVEGSSPRLLAKELWLMYVNAGYPEQLAEWSGLDHYYDMLEGGVIYGRVIDIDIEVTTAARALAEDA